MIGTSFEHDVQRLLTLMEEGERAVAAQDVPAVVHCTEAVNALMEDMTRTWTAVTDLASSEERAMVVRLSDLLRSALGRVERTQQHVEEWKQQTQDALRAMKNGQEAIGRYADSLGAHRRELFDLSA
ncbi:MAG TPA: hypothetical protein VFA38_09485 [Nitrospirales bacterium]|nr:hypothetical protein [Nitrospirales bacterium]